MISRMISRGMEGSMTSEAKGRRGGEVIIAGWGWYRWMKKERWVGAIAFPYVVGRSNSTARSRTWTCWARAKHSPELLYVGCVRWVVTWSEFEGGLMRMEEY